MQPRKPNKPVKPGQDIFVPRQARATFPTVGMSLPTRGASLNIGEQRREQPSFPKKHGRLRRFFTRWTWKKAVLTLLIVALGIGGFVGGKALYNLHRLFGGSIFGIFSSSKLKGEDVGRVNILLAGNSADDPGHGGANLTDSIMLISIDTKNNTGFMLSIPRDLWVKIPGVGYQKINDAYVAGGMANFSAPGYPNGGMGQLEQIVSQDFGVTIDYYALVNYAAIRDAVNAVGGISVDIKSCDPRGLYDPNRDYATNQPLVNLTNGWHTLNGEQALDLARARGDPSPYGIAYGFCGSDFTRTHNQRLMLEALKTKVETLGVLANPIKLTSLFDSIGSNVKTDLTLSDAHRLYDITKNVSNSNIQSLSLDNANGKNLLTSYYSDGEDSLIPALGVNNYSAIQHFIQSQTSNNPIVKEDANIVLLNATNTSGLAATFQHNLITQGFNVTAVGDAYGGSQATTTIIDSSNGKMPNTKAALIKKFGNNVTTTNPYAYSSYSNASFIVVLGLDQAGSASSTNSGSSTTTTSGQ